ncbi:hypothetical protein SRHO_G00247700 [Serrasalmus rhombeus]
MASSQDRPLQALRTELACLDWQITALLKKKDELFQQKSQLVSPLVVAPASTLQKLGDTVLTPALAPSGSWECQRLPDGLPDLHRHPSRSSPPATDSPFSAHHPCLYLCFGPRRPRSALCTGLGARVLDIVKCLLSALRRRDAFGTVVIHVGTNDISDRRSEVLKEHFQTLLDTARKKTDARIVISGPLPIYRRGSERFSRLFALQSWYRGWCACNGLDYVNNWSSF